MPGPGIVDDVLGRGCSPTLLAEQWNPRRNETGTHVKMYSEIAPETWYCRELFMEHRCCAVERRSATVRKRAGRPCWMSDELATEGHHLSGRTPDDQALQLKDAKTGPFKRSFEPGHRVLARSTDDAVWGWGCNKRARWICRGTGTNGSVRACESAARIATALGAGRCC